jgi:hypothetical protein
MFMLAVHRNGWFSAVGMNGKLLGPVHRRAVRLATWPYHGLAGDVAHPISAHSHQCMKIIAGMGKA